MKVTSRFFSIFLAVVVMLAMMPVTDQTFAAAKAKKVKITWNANGGKIGKAKTKTVSYKKGKKIGKLQANPTRAGYVFAGWWTQKAGGKKVTKATKAKKKTTFWARWQYFGKYYSESVFLMCDSSKVWNNEMTTISGADGKKSAVISEQKKSNAYQYPYKHRTIIRDGWIYEIDDIKKEYTKKPWKPDTSGGGGGTVPKPIKVGSGTDNIAPYAPPYTKYLPYTDYKYTIGGNTYNQRTYMNGKNVYGYETINSDGSMYDTIFLKSATIAPASIFVLNITGYTNTTI